MPRKLRLDTLTVKSFVTESERDIHAVGGEPPQTYCTGICCKINVPGHTCECPSHHC